MPPFGTPFVGDTTFAATTFGQSIRNRFSCSAWATVLLTGLSSEPPQPEHMIATPSRMLLSEMWVTLSSTRWPFHHLCNGKASSQANRFASGSLIFWMRTADGYPIGDTRRLYVIATFTCRPFGNFAKIYFNSTVVRCSSERALSDAVLALVSRVCIAVWKCNSALRPITRIRSPNFAPTGLKGFLSFHRNLSLISWNSSIASRLTPTITITVATHKPTYNESLGTELDQRVARDDWAIRINADICLIAVGRYFLLTL